MRLIRIMRNLFFPSFVFCTFSVTSLAVTALGIMTIISSATRPADFGASLLNFFYYDWCYDYGSFLFLVLVWGEVETCGAYWGWNRF